MKGKTVATRAALPVKALAHGRLQVAVPRFWGWSNVVFDYGGEVRRPCVWLESYC